MSTPASEVKSAIATEKATLESRVAALEASAKTWYEKHLPLLAAIGGAVIGGFATHIFKL
jgi:hypothetical protein